MFITNQFMSINFNLYVTRHQSSNTLFTTYVRCIYSGPTLIVIQLCHAALLPYLCIYACMCLYITFLHMYNGHKSKCNLILANLAKNHHLFNLWETKKTFCKITDTWKIYYWDCETLWIILPPNDDFFYSILLGNKNLWLNHSLLH